MPQDNRSHVVKAMKNETQGHVEGKHWKVVMRPDHNFLSVVKAIFSLNRKGCLVAKSKNARMCALGGLQKWGRFLLRHMISSSELVKHMLLNENGHGFKSVNPIGMLAGHHR